MKRFILTLSCEDRLGIVKSVAAFLAERDYNILESAQSRDESSEQFFMRVAFETRRAVTAESLNEDFASTRAAFSMEARFYDTAVKPRVLILVSKFGHCLNDLLYRYRIGALPIEIAAIVSNHVDFKTLAADLDIPFHHLPVTPDNKEKQETRLWQLFNEMQCDLMVLARYMQILSSALCGRLQGRAINIHHSFLPSFQGAKPYRQAYERGVKLIGATAHYVTEELDEGPIIEQDIARVDHGMNADDYSAVGRDVESVVLARAVKWHVERRILVHGRRTFVFR